MKRILTLTALTLAVSIGFAHAVDPIAPNQVAKLQSLIKPASGEEKWQEIPWQVSLWKARKMAAELGKPILLWAMDGHPLGCT